jgi:hypothetical protein
VTAQLTAARSALIGLPLGLRGYSADPVARFAWDGTMLVAQPTVWHALAVFTPKSVELQKDKIVLAGGWNAIAMGGSFSGPAGPAVPTKIEVRLNGADPAAVLPKLRDGLFFADEQQAESALPPEGLCALGGRRPGCHGGYQKSPRLIHSEDPVYTGMARARKFSGTSTVGLVVSEKGIPQDLWVVRPVGYGLDFEALKSVASYRFIPGQSDGRPIMVRLTVEVNFQDF